MLNIRLFVDVHGRPVEIDRRCVVDAFVEQRQGRRSIQVWHGADPGELTVLGIGARQDVESWLGFPLPVAGA